MWNLRTLVLLLLVCATLRASASSDSHPASCTATEYRQFDFWLGDWNVYEIGGSSPVAHVRVESLLGGCALHEDYHDTNGSNGQSFSIYDASRRVWHQTWVTNRGQLLVIEGNLESGGMVLTGTDRAPDGQERRVRGVWKPADGGVRETAVRSTDGGKSWTQWFDLMFRRRDDMNASDQQDKQTVAALDKQYQAAVEKNDAVTMDRILADDFVLVTGSGKTFRKDELLREAREGNIRYEGQSDSEQSVRVWGETAVVTAKLRERGTQGGKPFDATLWFSDTYVRTPSGWRYVFGQASLPLPKD